MPKLWITPEELPADYREEESTLDACKAASEILWGMSGRKFSGVETVTEEYARDIPDLRTRVHEMGLAMTDLSLIKRNLPEYRDDTHRRIKLRGRPVRDVVSVHNVNTGEEIAPTSYYLEDRSMLVFDHYITDRYAVTYSYGTPPPASGKMAAKQLAIQFTLLWGNREDECSLPSRVTSVNREGVSWTLLDSQDFIAELRTGIYAVDLFLKTVNPNKAQNRARVFSPDIPRGRRRGVN